MHGSVCWWRGTVNTLLLTCTSVRNVEKEKNCSASGAPPKTRFSERFSLALTMHGLCPRTPWRTSVPSPRPTHPLHSEVGPSYITNSLNPSLYTPLASLHAMRWWVLEGYNVNYIIVYCWCCWHCWWYATIQQWSMPKPHRESRFFIHYMHWPPPLNLIVLSKSIRSATEMLPLKKGAEVLHIVITAPPHPAFVECASCWRTC